MEQQDQAGFNDLLDLLRRGVLFALAVGLGAAALTYVLSKRIPPTFQSSATILVSEPDTSLQRFGVSLVTAPTIGMGAYEVAATSTPVLRQALADLGRSGSAQADLQSLRSSLGVTVENTQQSSLIHVSVRSHDPTAAASAANAVSNALVAWDKQRAASNLKTIITTLKAQITSLNAEIAQAKTSSNTAPGQLSGLENLLAQQALQLNAANALRDSAVGHLEILEPAAAASVPVAPHPAREGALAFVLGIMLVYGLLLLRDALDMRFRSTEDIARITNLPVLGEFPRLPGGGHHLPLEASNYLRTNVLLATAQDHPRVILVTSAGSRQGKTSVAISLAESLARIDYRTLLVDADLRRPMIGREYNLNAFAATSLRAALERPDEPLDPVAVRVEGGTVDIIPSFTSAPSPTEILARGFRHVLGRAALEYDVLVIDTPPVLPVADTLTMVPHVTGVVFAVSPAETDRRNVKAALGLLERVGVRVLGTVTTSLEKTRKRGGLYGYGYGHAYGHEAGHDFGPSETRATSNRKHATDDNLNRSVHGASLEARDARARRTAVAEGKSPRTPRG